MDNTRATRARIQRIIKEGGTLDRGLLAFLSDIHLSKRELELSDLAGEALRLSSEKYASTYLHTFFEILPWRDNEGNEILVPQEEFERRYYRVIGETSGFREIDRKRVEALLRDSPETFLIFRMIMEFNPDEIEYLLESKYKQAFSKDKIREIELHRNTYSRSLLKTWHSVVPVLAEIIVRAPDEDFFVELNQVLSRKFILRRVLLKSNWNQASELAKRGLSFSDLLYQRYIGGLTRHLQDAGSELKGDLIEDVLETLLAKEKISYYRTKAREKVRGWEQAADFYIPNRENATVIIEAKIAEDGGTARDKATRIENLAKIAGQRGVVCMAVVDGKGFRRINDVMFKVLLYCRGLVFSLSNLDEISPEIKKLLCASR